MFELIMCGLGLNKAKNWFMCRRLQMVSEDNWLELIWVSHAYHFIVDAYSSLVWCYPNLLMSQISTNYAHVSSLILQYLKNFRTTHQTIWIRFHLISLIVQFSFKITSFLFLLLKSVVYPEVMQMPWYITSPVFWSPQIRFGFIYPSPGLSRDLNFHNILHLHKLHAWEWSGAESVKNNTKSHKSLKRNIVFFSGRQSAQKNSRGGLWLDSSRGLDACMTRSRCILKEHLDQALRWLFSLIFNNYTDLCEETIKCDAKDKVTKLLLSAPCSTRTHHGPSDEGRRVDVRFDGLLGLQLEREQKLSGDREKDFTMMRRSRW